MKVKRQLRFLKLDNGKEAIVPGWCYKHAGGDSFHFSYAHSLKQNKVVFMDSHTTDGLVGDDWVPVSSSIPMQVVARTGLEDGMINTLEDYAKVFMKDDQVVGTATYYFENLKREESKRMEIKRMEEEEKSKQFEHHCESETECELQLEEALIGKDILAPINYTDE